MTSTKVSNAIPERWEDVANDPLRADATKDLCLREFKRFVQLTFRYVFRKTFIWHPDLHDCMEKELMLIWMGKQRNTIENMPPRYGKTEVVDIFVAWAFGHNPKCEFMHLSFSEKLTTRNSARIKEIMSSAFYQFVFKTRIDQKKNAAEDWQTLGGGRFCARATGGQLTGFGAGQTIEAEEDGSFKFSGMIWIDDPLKPKDAHTVNREKINTDWHETIKSRRNSKTTPTLVTMQRIHEGDFTAELMSDTSENFKCVKLKALRDDGTALWPFKHDVAELHAMEQTNVYSYSSQYQQEPSPKGGTIFKAHWWQYCYELPEMFEDVIITGDTSQKIKEHNDYSVFQAWGRFKGKIYLIDQVRGKWEAPQLKRLAVSFIKRIKQSYPRLRAVYIEDKVSGTGLIQSLKADALCTIKGIPRGTGANKLTRAYDAAPHIQAGNVVLLEGAPYVGIFVAEHTSFNAEDTHLHDDQVDPMMDGCEILLGKLNSGSSILIF